MMTPDIDYSIKTILLVLGDYDPENESFRVGPGFFKAVRVLLEEYRQANARLSVMHGALEEIIMISKSGVHEPRKYVKPRGRIERICNLAEESIVAAYKGTSPEPGGEGKP